MEGAGLPFSPVAVVPPTPQAPSAFSGLLSRNISFVNHYEFRWKHRTFHKAIALGTSSLASFLSFTPQIVIISKIRS
jgi:hypothetical protein